MLAFVRKLMGRTIALIGLGLMWVIPVWFMLQFFGVAQSGTEQFGVFGYGVILAAILFPGLGLLLLGIKIAADK